MESEISYLHGSDSKLAPLAEEKSDYKESAKENHIPWWVRSPEVFSSSLKKDEEEYHIANGLFVLIFIGLGRALVRRFILF